MKTILVVILSAVLIVSLVGCETLHQWRGRRMAERLYSEENYQQLAELFETVEDELEEFIMQMREIDMLYTSELRSIVFPPTGDNLNRYNNLPFSRIIVYEGEILEEMSTEHYVDTFMNNSELTNLLKQISEAGVILSIAFGRWRETEDVRVEFVINTDFTPFIVGNNNFNNAFFYIESSYEASPSVREIRENWYMWISPGPG